jgi:hypothetical protein
MTALFSAELTCTATVPETLEPEAGLVMARALGPVSGDLQDARKTSRVIKIMVLISSPRGGECMLGIV